MATVTNKDKYGNTLSVDDMLKRFKKKVQQEGILQELKKRECFVPKSVRRKEKREAHERLLRKQEK